MTDNLILHIGEKNISSWSMRGFLALAAKELDFETRTISLRQDKDRSQRLAVSPTGKVPVLHHTIGSETRIIPDSLAIIEYLEETFPPPKHVPLWPTDAGQRAHARWLSAMMHSGFMKLRESMSFNLCFIDTPPAATPEALAEAAEILSHWERTLTHNTVPGPYLFGNFTAADIMFAPVVVRLTAFKVASVSTPRSAAYMTAVLGHPAVRRWMEPARQLEPHETY